MSGLGTVVMRAFMEELAKLAAISSPSIKAPPTPGGMGTTLSPTPALGATNLQKTNYTSVGTKTPKLDITQTSEQKALAPPVVRS
jgi:hypothetical protein